MHKLIAVLGLVMASQPAAAFGHDPGCDYRLDLAISLEARGVVIEGEHTHLELRDDGVYGAQGALPLTPQQRALARTYKDELTALVPAVTDLAWRGARLGIQSIAIVGAALGGDPDQLDKMIAHTEALSLRLHRELDGRHLPPRSTIDDAGADTEIAHLAADAGAHLVGGIASLVVTAVFDPDAAQARSEFLQRLVEHRIEPRATALSAEADQVCLRLRRIDALETRLGLVDAVHGAGSI